MPYIELKPLDFNRHMEFFHNYSFLSHGHHNNVHNSTK